ncbi:MAG: penicillin-insensitive murein endopeptidase, partial [Solirubrobacterales bacterium]
PRTQHRLPAIPSRLRAPRPASNDPAEKQAEAPRIAWRRSIAVGTVSSGRLVRGVKLPASGRHHFTWDPILERSPDRRWRRWGTDFVLRKLLKVIREFRRSNAEAPRVTVGDLSRPRGGDFGPRFGLPGHMSHQNGLDVDVYYPRLDRAELWPEHPRQIDRPLAQDLVDRFVAAGAEYVFVGPATGLHGPPGIVQALTNHDDHMHVRFR